MSSFHSRGSYCSANSSIASSDDEGMGYGFQQHRVHAGDYESRQKQQQQQRSSGGGGGILRRRMSDVSTASTATSRSRDSSVDSMNSMQDPYDMNASFRMPVSSGGGGARRSRRASLGAIPMTSTTNESEMNYRVKSKATNPSPVLANGAKKKVYRTTRRRMTRRASLSDAYSSDDGSTGSNSGHNRFQQSQSDRPQRRASLSDERPSWGNDSMQINVLPRIKMGRRSSMGDSPSSDTPVNFHPQPRQQAAPPPPPRAAMGRRNSLTHVSVSVAPIKTPLNDQPGAAPRPRGILRGASLSDSNHSYNSYSSEDSSKPTSYRIPTSADPSSYRVPTKMGRRSSLTDIPKTSDGSMSSRSSLKMMGGHGEQSGSFRMSRRSSLSDAPRNSNADVSYRMGRRPSLSDAPNNNSNHNEQQQQGGSFRMGRRSSLGESFNEGSFKLPKEGGSFRMGRRSSLGESFNEGSFSVPQGGSLRMGRRSSLSETPNEGSFSVPQGGSFRMSRRSSLSDTAPKTPKAPVEGSMSQRMSRRSSLSDAPKTQKTPVEGSMSQRMSRRSSLSDTPKTPKTPVEGSMSQRMGRRSSLSDAPKVEGSMSARTGRRSSLSNVTDPSTPRSILKSDTSGDAASSYRVPTKASRRSSLSDAPQNATLTPLNDSYRAPMKASRRSSLSDAPMNATLTPLNDSYRVPMKASRRSSMGDGTRTSLNDSYRVPIGAMEDKLTPLPGDSNKKSILRNSTPRDDAKTPTSAQSMPYGSVQKTSLNDVAGPPLSGGYCVPLKSLSERNDRSILKGGTNSKNEEQSPSSMSERSKKKSFRSTRSSSTSSYYSDQSLQSSISSIPTDVPMDLFESLIYQSTNAYDDSTASHDNSRKTSRSSGLALSDSSDDDTFGYDSDDHSVTQRLDEMESSTKSGGIGNVDDSWSVHNLAADIFQTDNASAATPFKSRKRKTGNKFSIKIPTASMDSQSQSSNRDDSFKLMQMEGDNWDDEQSGQSFADEGPTFQQSRRQSLQFDEIMPRAARRVSSLAFDDSSLGGIEAMLDNQNSLRLVGDDFVVKPRQPRRSSIKYGDESSLTAHQKQPRRSSLKYGGDENSVSRAGRRPSVAWDEGSLTPSDRRPSVAWDETSLSLSDRRQILDLDEGSLSPPGLNTRSKLKVDYGSDDDIDEGSLGDFAGSAASSSEGSLGEFAGSVAASSRPSLSGFNPSSEGSLGDFAGVVKPSSEGSLGDFAGGGGGDSDSDSSSEESDGLIRDDEIFRDALQHVAESTTPPGFDRRRRSTSRRGSIGDYTLSLSGRGEVDDDIDRSEKSFQYGRRRSISSIGCSGIDTSIRSRAISTISEDSFEITTEELGIFNDEDDNELFPQQLQLYNKERTEDDDDGSFMSCSSESEEYASSTEFYDSDLENEREQEQRIKDKLKWGVGTMAIGAVAGWLVKRFRKGKEDDLDFDEADELAQSMAQSTHDELAKSFCESAHDELGQSIAQSVLDESMNFSGADQLWGWASIGDGGASLSASGEFVVGALHMPGTETLIAAATTSSAAPTTTTAAAAATAAAAEGMAVGAAANAGTVAVATTSAINGAVATGSGLGIGGVVSGTVGGGVIAAVGGTGAGASSTAIIGSACGAVVLGGLSYCSSSSLSPWGDTTLVGGVQLNASDICIHPDPNNQTGVFRLSLDISGMDGQDEDWGWMPFSDGAGDTNTTGEMLKDLWEELFASIYNNITENGCNDLFERRVLGANLLSTNHTGTSEDLDQVLETEWEVTVSCWKDCPTEPIFGAELERRLASISIPIVGDSEVHYTGIVNDSNDTLTAKSLVSELDFKSCFEKDVHEAAVADGWEKPEDTSTSHPSEKPTANPTEEPSENPSLKSSENPSENPTENPSENPSETPSESPSENLSENPSEIHSEETNGRASRRPGEKLGKPGSRDEKKQLQIESQIVMENLTVEPSKRPTLSRTNPPTKSPTFLPTNPPTESPTDSPSESPTKPPTKTPTESPTKPPTKTPTESPTVLPTDSPTKSNIPTHYHNVFIRTSSVPSVRPSISMDPSPTPTVKPSTSPTSTPSESPSTRPTSIPSESPSTTPTIGPSAEPSASPSESPSDSPSAEPNESPSASPSYAPSSDPIVSPSDIPSSSPSTSPVVDPVYDMNLISFNNINSAACCSYHLDKCVICKAEGIHAVVTQETCDTGCGKPPGSLVFLENGAPEHGSCLPRFSTSCEESAMECCGPATCRRRPGLIEVMECLTDEDVANP